MGQGAVHIVLCTMRPGSCSVIFTNALVNEINRNVGQLRDVTVEAVMRYLILSVLDAIQGAETNPARSRLRFVLYAPAGRSSRSWLRGN
jgi:hypothetical protein